MGERLETCRSPSTTSMEKRAPAMGALNVAATPAAAPQATKERSRRAETCSSWPTADPMAEPMWTMGPSRPAEPPEPMVRAAARALVRITLKRMTPVWRPTASITSGMPDPFTSGASRQTMSPTKAPPMGGMSRRCQRGAACMLSRPMKNSPWAMRIISRKAMAPLAASTPMTTATTTTNTCSPRRTRPSRAPLIRRSPCPRRMDQ